MSKQRLMKMHKNQAVGVSVDPPTVYRHLLTDWRLRHGMSMGRLAQLLDVNISTISRWESHECFPDVARCILIEYLTDGEIKMLQLLHPEEVRKAQETLKVIDYYKEAEREKMRNLRKRDRDDEDVLRKAVRGKSLPENDATPDGGGEEEEEAGA